MSSAGPLSRRVIARYHLNTSAQALSADLGQAKIRAIQTNSLIALRRESERDYRLASSPRRLAAMVRFEATSADSVAFNGLGAVAGGGTQHLYLVNTYGESVEIRVYASGGHEIVRP